MATNKGTFLNIDFMDGAIVALPYKTAMRVFRGIGKRFAETSSVIKEIFNTSRGAMGKGGCPITLYVQALAQALRTVFRFLPEAKSFSAVELAMSFFAARSLGGWGVPSLATFLSNESTSVLTDSILLTKSVCKLAATGKSATPLARSSHESVAALYNALFPATFSRPSLWGFLGSPQTVHATGVKDTTGF